MKYYAYKQVYNWLNTKALAIPSLVKTVFYLSISAVMLAVSSVLVLICVQLVKSIAGIL